MGVAIKKDVLLSVLSWCHKKDWVCLYLVDKEFNECVETILFKNSAFKKEGVSITVQYGLYPQWDINETQGGSLGRDNTLYVAKSGGFLLPPIEYTSCPWFTPIQLHELTEHPGSPSSWSWSSSKTKHQLYAGQSRYYFEIGMLWTQSTGDILFGISDLTERKVTRDTCPCWGVWLHTYVAELVYFKHNGTTDFGGGGPTDVVVITKGQKAPFVLSLLVDLPTKSMNMLVDGKCVYSTPFEVENLNCLRTFICTYGNSSCAQILNSWHYPDIANWWLFDQPKPLFSKHPQALFENIIL
eukprot:TRINITY_DN888_c0_g1_i2.p1 TRINITY_DN888_c0_g1~~TRINITY_DN888_c0_g1_i2.p1  ORF type:complete len:313 (+),score=71.72 TRINITY_DN888_c0_g1_i2:46-939(+)